MTTSTQARIDDTLMPKLLLILTVLYVGVTEFANWAPWVQIVIGAMLLVAAIAMIMSGRSGKSDRAWGSASIGILTGTLVPLMGHLIHP